MKYYVEINERTNKGKALLALLESEDVVKIKPYRSIELIEEDILAEEMNKVSNSNLLSYTEGKKEFARIKKQLAK